MTARPGLARRMAVALVDHAARRLPARRSEWGDAMRAELPHLKSDRHALEWALGCMLASFIERVRAMNVSRLRVSRWLLMLEWLVCFGPLTLLWATVVSFVAQDGSASRELIASTFMGALGPVALVVAVAGTMFSRASAQRWLIKTLLAGFLALGVLQLLVMGRIFGLRWWFAVDWSLVVLLSALPALGCLHLLCLAYPESERRLST